MPYTDDPKNIPADQVRLLLGDTDVAHERLSDAAIDFLLFDQNDNTTRAAARGAEFLAAKYATLPSEKKVGPLMLMYGTRAITVSAQYAEIAQMLWAQASQEGVIPWAGGISRTDKLDRASDTDRIRPTFARRMMHYPNSEAQSVAPEEILSGPAELP